MRGVPESLALSIVIDATCWREDISLPHDCGSDRSRRVFLAFPRVRRRPPAATCFSRTVTEVRKDAQMINWSFSRTIQ